MQYCVFHIFYGTKRKKTTHVHRLATKLMLNTCVSKGGRLRPALVGWKKQPKRQQDLDPPLQKGILAFQHENAKIKKNKKQKQQSAPLNWANTC